MPTDANLGEAGPAMGRPQPEALKNAAEVVLGVFLVGSAAFLLLNCVVAIGEGVVSGLLARDCIGELADLGKEHAARREGRSPSG